MRVTRSRAMVASARAEALFVSDLSMYSASTTAQVAAAIGHAVRRYGGIRGCLERVATEYGNHPEFAVHRMRWAHRTLAATYGAERPRP